MDKPDLSHQMEMRDMMSQLMLMLHEKASKQGLDTKSSKSSERSTEYRKEGNDLFKKEKHNEIDHRKILNFYNKSIAYAPPNSEELALAYSNRSALWLHVKKYKLCMIDIGRAESITRSDELKKRLSDRRQSCQSAKILAPVKEVYKAMELPEFTPSKVVPCASEAITLQCNEKYGRHFVANRYIKPGEIIMIEECPYMSVKAHHVYILCSHCFAFAWAGIPCDSCVYTIYCNESCKEAAWKQYHDTMCSKLPSLHSMKVDQIIFNVKSTVTRILDIIAKTEQIEDMIEEATKMDRRKELTLESLLTNDKLDCRKFKSVYNLTSNNRGVDYKGGRATDESIFEKLKYIVQHNSFGFHTATASAVAVPCDCKKFESCLRSNCANKGGVLGVCSSLFNHSCDPNVSRMFIPGPKIVMLTTRPVKKGEQLCVCYGPTFDSVPKPERQKTLLYSHSFTCDCAPCKENWPAGVNSRSPDPSKMYVLQSQIARTFGRHGEMFRRPCNTWSYNKKNLKGAIKISEYIYENFDARDAYWANNSFAVYIFNCHYALYGENADFPNSCQR